MNKIEFIDASTNSIILEKRLVKNVKSNEILKSTFTDAVKLVALDTVNTTGVIGQSESGIFVASVDHQGVVVALSAFQDVPPVVLYYIISQLVDVINDYFGDFNPSILAQNYDIIYQLLHEMFDHGLPYTMEPALLKQVIPPPSLLDTVINAVPLPTSIAPSLSISKSVMNSKCPWRMTGLKYAHNEIFFDVIEELDCVIDEDGFLVTSVVIGLLECRSRLSGMPDLVLALGNRHLLTPGSVAFHPAIKYSRWASEGVLNFIPPDGSFVLFEYTIDIGLQQLPLLIKPSLKKSSNGTTNKLDISVCPRLGTEKSFEYLNVSVKLPNVNSVHSNVTIGTCNFDSIEGMLNWNIGAMSFKTGQKQPFASLTLSDPISSFTKLEFECSFRVNMHSLSGLRIDGLSVHNEAYRPFKGGRSYVKSGRVVFRL